MMRMMISVMRWRGRLVMSGRVLRMRSVASPMMGMRGLLGRSGGRTVGVSSDSSLVNDWLVPSRVEGVVVAVGV